MAKKDAALSRFIFIGTLLILVSIISCSSHDPADKSSVKETADSIDVKSVIINGVTISVGDSADAVYIQIGRGLLTVATNDPANQSGILIFRTYVSEDKTYRISFCKSDNGYYQVCRISLLKSPQKTNVGGQSLSEQPIDPKRHRRLENVDNNRNRSRIFTNDDLKKMDQKNN